MSDLAAQLIAWIESLPADIDVIKSVLESDSVDAKARQYAGGALNYLVARMDLVPDWTEQIGLLDDAMVLRLCMDLGNVHGLTEDVEDPDIIVGVGKMLNDVEAIQDILGDTLHARLRDHCKRLSFQEVRGRTPSHLVDDPSLRAALYQDIEAKLVKLPTPVFQDVDAAMARFKSYLHAKLA